MCKEIQALSYSHGRSRNQGCKTLPSPSKCVLKSRSQVLHETSLRKKGIVVPARVLFDAANYALGIATEGIKKEERGELYWHDPWGFREALLYSLRNIAAAACCSNHRLAELLSSHANKFARNPESSISHTVRILKDALEEKHGSMSDGVCLYRTSKNPSFDVSLGEITSTVRLLDGTEMPRLGFGTAIFDKDDGPSVQVYTAVLSAVEQGYRHFDCAQCYRNEELIGRAIQDSRIKRSSLFLATKLSHWEDYGGSATRRLVYQQLKKLQTEYLDLYYLHDDIGDVRKEKAAWQALENLHRKGVIRHLGLSNYSKEGIKRILSYARVPPSVLQIKYDVYHPGYKWAEKGVENVVDFARGIGMAVVGYANFSGWPSLLRAPSDPHICRIAQRYGRSSVQVILRHGLQKGLCLIPASVNPAHIKSNADIFDFSLDADDVSYLDSLANLASSEPVPWLPMPAFLEAY